MRIVHSSLEGDFLWDEATFSTADIEANEFVEISHEAKGGPELSVPSVKEQTIDASQEGLLQEPM